MSMRRTLILPLVTWTGLSCCGIAAITQAIPANAADAAKPAPAKDAAWKPLFDGKSLDGWKKTAFPGGGEVKVEKAFKGEGAAIVVEPGTALSGFNWTKDAPKTNYEIELEALKIKGDDFMCGLTFPVGDSHATFVVGGWGGGVVGISSIDNSDASENPTTKYMSFKADQWYKVRVRVTPKKIEAWLDNEQVVNQEITGKKISLRPGDVYLSVPIGLCTFRTSAAYRNIKLRTLPS